MSGKFRIFTVLLVLGLLLTACATPGPDHRPPLRRRRRPKPSRLNPPPCPKQPKPAAEPVNLVVWWWGEQKHPALRNG